MSKSPPLNNISQIFVFGGHTEKRSQKVNMSALRFLLGARSPDVLYCWEKEDPGNQRQMGPQYPEQ